MEEIKGDSAVEEEETKVKNEILEMVTQCLTETHLHKVLQENDEYRRAVEEEVELYEGFLANLSEWQKEEFEHFLVAANESAMICERLSYQQGMKDLMVLLNSLQE